MNRTGLHSRARARRPGWRSAVLLAAAWAVGSSAAGGCASHDHVNAGTSIDQDVRRAAVPVPGNLRFVEGRRLPPIAVEVALVEPPPAADPVGGATAPQESGPGERIEFRRAIVGEELVEILRATNVFENVIPVGEGRGRADLALARDEARSKGASFLIEAKIEAASLRRMERAFVVPLVIWACSGAPSFWIHNHDYRLEAQLRLRLHDLNTGEALPERPLEPARADEWLNFHERTSSIWTYFLTNVFPSPFCPIDEEKVARALAPAALGRPVAQFLERLGEAFAGEVYRFESKDAVPAAPAGPGPAIEVRYPPVDARPIYLLKRTVRYSLLVEAAPGAVIREVRVNGRLVFPARSRVGEVAWRRVPIEMPARVEATGAFVVEAVDSAGKRTRRAIVAREDTPAGRRSD